MYTFLFGYTLSRSSASNDWLYTQMSHYTDHLVRTPNRKIYTAAFIILWILVIATFACGWILQRSIVVVHNTSAVSMYIAIYSNTGIRHLENAFSAVVTLLADGILVGRDICHEDQSVWLEYQIWRCFVLWADNKWVLLPLSVAQTANIGKIEN